MIRSNDNPFQILKEFRRVMISLGPLNEKVYCPYSCAFCYVQSGFLSYANMSIDDICGFLLNHVAEYDVIYISGDTDSFAPPRMSLGIQLIETISNRLSKDIWFSTRTVFSDESHEQLRKINCKMSKDGLHLFGSISITAPIQDELIEPKPIPSINDRIKQLGRFKDAGIKSVLQMRPFLPLFSFNDYCDLINKCEMNVDVILGERWYFDPDMVIYNRVMGSRAICSGTIEKQNGMDFDDNNKKWLVWSDLELEEKIAKLCAIKSIPFFMRSAPAIEFLRRNGGI